MLTDPASILANRQGTLTDDQRDLLRLTSGVTFWYALGSVVVIGGIVAWAMNMQRASLPAEALSIPAYFWIVLTIAIGAPLLYLGAKMVRSARITHEVASGNLVSEEGRVEWTGRRYRVAASVKRLSSVCGSFDLMPGRYRFYLLPGSRYLLSADPLDAPQVFSAALTEVLGRVLGFTNDDLAANREGRVSPAQASRSRSQALLTGLIATVILAVLAGASFLAFTFRSPGYLVFVGLWFIVTLLVAPDLIRDSLERLRERPDRIASVQGSGYKSFRYRRPAAVIVSYVVNGERFDVSGRGAFDAMVDGETYRLYYAPASKTILSLEAIPRDSPPPSS